MHQFLYLVNQFFEFFSHLVFFDYELIKFLRDIGDKLIDLFEVHVSVIGPLGGHFV